MPEQGFGPRSRIVVGALVALGLVYFLALLTGAGSVYLYIWPIVLAAGVAGGAIGSRWRGWDLAVALGAAYAAAYFLSVAVVRATSDCGGEDCAGDGIVHIALTLMMWVALTVGALSTYLSRRPHLMGSGSDATSGSEGATDHVRDWVDRRPLLVAALFAVLGGLVSALLGQVGRALVVSAGVFLSAVLLLTFERVRHDARLFALSLGISLVVFWFAFSAWSGFLRAQ
jgi:hypothetical protein